MSAPRDLALCYRYVHEWRQWEWSCLDCSQRGLRTDSPYDVVGTIKVAMRHSCNTLETMGT